jgi:hypothetical protein
MPSVVGGAFEEIYIVVGDQNLSDSINLTDFNHAWNQSGGAGFTIPNDSLQAQANQMLPGGVAFTMQGDGTLLIEFSLLVSAPTGDLAIANLQSLFRKMYTARRAAGGMGLSTAVTIWVRFYGSSHYVFFDVLDGMWLPALPKWPQTMPATAGVARFTCMPYGRGEQVTLTASPVLVEGLGATEVTLSLSGSPTGGAFQLAFGGNTSSGIPWNASAATVQSALAATTGIGTGNILCYGGPLTSNIVTCYFAGSIGLAPQPTFTVASNALTGGSSPSVNIVLTNPGGQRGFMVSNVPGDVEAIATVKATDSSYNSKIIRSLEVYRRSWPGMAVNDFTPAYHSTSSSPGADFSDATAVNHICTRITTTLDWQQMGAFAPAFGSFQNGEFNVKLRVRDASVPAVIGTLDYTVNLASGVLTAGGYTVQIFTTDGTSIVPSTPATAVVVPSVPLLFIEDCESGTLAQWTYHGDPPIVAESGIFNSAAVAHSGTSSILLGVITGFVGANSIVTGTILPVGSIISLKFWINPVSVANSVTLIFANWGNYQFELVGSGGGATYGLQVRYPMNTYGAAQSLYTFAAGTAINAWHSIEITYDASAGFATASANLYFDGTLLTAVADNTSAPVFPSFISFSNLATSSLPGFMVYIDDVAVANQHIGTTAYSALGADIVLTWGSNPTAGQQYLYYTEPGQLATSHGPWRLPISSGSLTYTLSDNQSGLPVSQLPAMTPPTQFAELKIQVALVVTSGAPQWQDVPQGTVSCQVGNGEWEHVMIPAVDLPSIVTPEEQSSPNWIVRVLGRAGGNVFGALDWDAAWVEPVDEDQVTATQRTNAPGQAIQQIDTRRDGRMSGMLLSKIDGSVIGQMDLTGSGFRLGPGNNIIGVIMETWDANGDLISDTDLACTLVIVYEPRFLLLRGNV